MMSSVSSLPKNGYCWAQVEMNFIEHISVLYSHWWLFHLLLSTSQYNEPKRCQTAGLVWAFGSHRWRLAGMGCQLVINIYIQALFSNSNLFNWATMFTILCRDASQQELIVIPVDRTAYDKTYFFKATESKIHNVRRKGSNHGFKFTVPRLFSAEVFSDHWVWALISQPSFKIWTQTQWENYRSWQDHSINVL